MYRIVCSTRNSTRWNLIQFFKHLFDDKISITEYWLYFKIVYLSNIYNSNFVSYGYFKVWLDYFQTMDKWNMTIPIEDSFFQFWEDFHFESLVY